MKKGLRLAVVLLSSTVLLGSCGKTEVEEPPIVDDNDDKDVKVVGVSVAETEVVDCDFTKQLTATVLPENATNKVVTWSSSDKTVATVDGNGLVYGVKNGTATITATTQDGSFKANCVVTVSGFHKSTKVWENFGKIENNTSYNTEEGSEDFEIVTDNEDYTEVKFNRSKTKEWASFRCWYNQINATSLDLDVELVSGALPSFLVELSGELNFKQFWRVPLTVGERTTVSYNLTDYNLKTGTDGNGSWGFMFFEFDNPNDGDDTNKDADSEVVLRLHKVQLKTDTAKKPEVVSGLKFDQTSKKLVFNKDTAASRYKVDVVKVDGETETPLTTESQITRFNAVENIPGMKLSFTPKKEQNFANVPGTYKARIKGVNSVGEAEYCDYVTFTIDEPPVESAYESVNFANDGAMYPNQWNGNTTYAIKDVAEGKQISFTSSSTEGNPSWDAILLDFDKTQTFEKFYIDFEVKKSTTALKNIGIQFNDWAASEPENSDGNQKEFFDITGLTGVIHKEFDITVDVSKGLGNVGLMFDRDAGIGDVEIVVSKIGLTKADAVTSAYSATNFSDNGTITPNQWNGNKTYKSELVEAGYKLSFTGDAKVTSEETYSWDSFLLKFDKDAGYKKFEFEFEVITSTVHLDNILIQCNDWAASEPENSDGNQKEYINIADKEGKITHSFDITTDLSKGIGELSLAFDRTVGLGDVEIMIYSIALTK